MFKDYHLINILSWIKLERERITQNRHLLRVPDLVNKNEINNEIEFEVEIEFEIIIEVETETEIKI